jgi:hypothetical protein
MPRHYKTAKRRTHRRKGGFIPYYNPFTGTYKPFHKQDYRKQIIEQTPVAEIKQTSPNKLELSANDYGTKTTVTMTKPGTRSVATAYSPEERMKNHYTVLAESISGNKDCLDEESYDIVKDMDEVCMKKNWLMRKTNKNCRLVDKLKQKGANKKCEPESPLLGEDEDEDLEEMMKRQEEEERKEDEKWEIKEGGKSRRRHKKSKRARTRTRRRTHRPRKHT